MPNRFSDEPENRNVYQNIGDHDDGNDHVCQNCGASVSDTSTAIPDESCETGCFKLCNRIPSAILGDNAHAYPDRHSDNSYMQNTTWEDTGEEIEGTEEETWDMPAIARGSSKNSDYVDCPLNDQTRARAEPDQSLPRIAAVSSQYASAELFEVRIVTSTNYCLSCRRPECRHPDQCGKCVESKKIQRVPSNYAWNTPEEVQHMSVITVTRVASTYAEITLAEQRIIDKDLHEKQVQCPLQPHHHHHA